MKRSDFNYHLPPHLIAQYPLPERSASRLMVLQRGGIAPLHRRFSELPEFLGPDDLLVFNDTRVIPARLYGSKASGGKVEILMERLTGPCEGLAHIRASRSPRTGAVIRLSVGRDAAPGSRQLRVVGREGDLFRVASEGGVALAEILGELGHVPLPPYIERADERADVDRYQTVYARRDGAVAAPTAGLHFTDALLAGIDARGVRRVALTLHVGAGTFQPVREDDIGRHVMHREFVQVDETVCAAVRETRRRGGRVVAVGTTSVRALESASLAAGTISPFQGDTEIFIYPGHAFRSVDAIITNFHLPESTLLMLVSAFAGRELIMAAYRQAIEAEYRFFSYGDAMLILPASGAGGSS